MKAGATLRGVMRRMYILPSTAYHQPDSRPSPPPVPRPAVRSLLPTNEQIPPALVCPSSTSHSGYLLGTLRSTCAVTAWLGSTELLIS
jgi:hypothetical protein